MATETIKADAVKIGDRIKPPEGSAFHRIEGVSRDGESDFPTVTLDAGWGTVSLDPSDLVERETVEPLTIEVVTIGDLEVGDLWRKAYGDTCFSEVLAVRRESRGGVTYAVIEYSTMVGRGEGHFRLDLPAERRPH